MAASKKIKATPSSERRKTAGDWAFDEHGQPMVKITMTASELVPTGNYANVTIGPAQATKFVSDDPKKIRESMDELGATVEEIIAEHRQLVLDQLQAVA